jgi:hypothetical protein
MFCGRFFFEIQNGGGNRKKPFLPKQSNFFQVRKSWPWHQISKNFKRKKKLQISKIFQKFLFFEIYRNSREIQDGVSRKIASKNTI